LPGASGNRAVTGTTVEHPVNNNANSSARISSSNDDELCIWLCQESWHN
jgi:hypothetical protein